MLPPEGDWWLPNTDCYKPPDGERILPNSGCYKLSRPSIPSFLNTIL